MSKTLRFILIIFAAITAGSFIYSLVVNKHLETVAKFEKDGNDGVAEQEQKNCKQLIATKVCTAPMDSYDRWSCSDYLASNHCDKYMDTGYLIRDEEREKYAHPTKDWRVEVLKGRLGK